ncbi:MAG: 5'/3'-nucleotidase SurE [Acidimicrobiales bacterium]
MRLLVTNDDGIESEGIQVLVRHLALAGHDLLVVAPDRNYSGSGAALGDLRPDQPLAVKRVRLDATPDVEAWALAGPPALTVVAARLGAFGAPPELVVSGINAGLNTGRSILHSGTVGAALTAQNFGFSGLAVSLDLGDRWYWDTAAALAVELLDRVARGPARSVLNLNVPACRREEVRGIRWARLAPFGAVRAAVSTRTDDEVQFELTASGYVAEPDTDQGTVDEGWAAITTLIGIAEAWPPEDEAPMPEPDYESHVAPGAPVHPVHEIPDASEQRWLRRPVAGPAT